MAIICSACFLIKEKTEFEDLIDETDLVEIPDSLLVLESLELDSTEIQPFYPQEEKINELRKSDTELQKLKKRVNTNRDDILSLLE